MHSKLLARWVLSCVALTAVVWAHGTGPRIMGIVRAVTEHAITVETMQHQQVTLQLDDETTYRGDSGAAQLQDVRVGDRIVVHGENRPGGLFAEVVRFAHVPETEHRGPR